MTMRRVVLGFHGCDAALAQRVAAGDADLQPSQNDYDWLGHGLYFWEESASRAQQWAVEAKRRGSSSVTTPGVIGAVIDLGDCLTLAEPESVALAKLAYQELSAISKATGRRLVQNTGRDFGARYLDCAVFEVLHVIRQSERRPPYDTVRAFFAEGSEIYPGAGIREQDHVQICVRNPKRILGFFLPRLG